MVRSTEPTCSQHSMHEVSIWGHPLAYKNNNAGTEARLLPFANLGTINKCCSNSTTDQGRLSSVPELVVCLQEAAMASHAIGCQVSIPEHELLTICVNWFRVNLQRQGYKVDITLNKGKTTKCVCHEDNSTLACSLGVRVQPPWLSWMTGQPTDQWVGRQPPGSPVMQPFAASNASHHLQHHIAKRCTIAGGL